MDITPLLKREYHRSLPTARRLAERFRSTSPHPLYQGENLVRYYRYRCGQIGFLAGLAGAPLLPVAIPLNLLFLLRRRIELLEGLALLGGFDPLEQLVQVKIWRILGGGEELVPIEGVGGEVGKRGALHTLKKKGAGKLAGKLVGKLLPGKGGGKLIPVVGGVISGGLDLHLCSKTGKAGIETFLGCRLVEVGRGRLGKVPGRGSIDPPLLFK